MLNKAAFIKSLLAISCLILTFFFCLASAGAQDAADENQVKDEMQGKPHFELDEIVVTATREGDLIRDIPRNVTVITSDDIEQATSNNVVDLIARESGVNMRSLFGHDKVSGIDIRGMGDTSGSNVIVMVDGYRLNPADMASPDFSSIPLDQIERIEIVRGAGSVVYGDGAVGGVINIITKKGKKEPEARVYTSYGSYKTIDTRASYGGQVERLRFNINADYYDSDGYRDNGFFEKKDVGARCGYDLTDFVSFSLSGSHHEDTYGLPAYVLKDDIDSEERRTSTFRPDDWGETTDNRFTGGIEFDFGNWGILNINGGRRFRDNSYIMGYSPLLTDEEQTDQIDEDTKYFDAGFVKEYKIREREHRLQCGIDYYKTDYFRESLTQNERKNSEVESLGMFLMNRFSLLKNLALHLGYRHNSYKGEFRTDLRQTFGTEKRWINGDPYKRDWINSSYDTGIVYSLNPANSLFASYATSFRTPNVDEFAQADEDLEPQEGGHIEIGSRHRLWKIAEFSATIFQTKVRDEIYYGEDPVTGLSVNRNYDETTIRRGLETDIKVYPTDCLYIWGNYTYMTAKFEDKETWVPLVPENKTSFGLEWKIFNPLLFAVTGTWVGSRYDGNDENNDRYEELEPYTVFDGKLTYTYKGLKVFFGVNNIFNELYSTTAYSETYYSMPDRSFYGGAEFKF